MLFLSAGAKPTDVLGWGRGWTAVGVTPSRRQTAFAAVRFWLCERMPDLDYRIDFKDSDNV